MRRSKRGERSVEPGEVEAVDRGRCCGVGARGIAAGLPVDAHSLIALSAPRPLFIGSGLPGQGDAWVDPKGMFMAAAAADLVWELLGADGLPTDEMPAPGDGLADGALAWRQHLGGHANEPNWEAFLDFAARYFE